MLSDPKETAELITFTEKICYGKLHFLVQCLDQELFKSCLSDYFPYKSPTKLHQILSLVYRCLCIQLENIDLSIKNNENKNDIFFRSILLCIGLKERFIVFFMCLYAKNFAESEKLGLLDMASYGVYKVESQSIASLINFKVHITEAAIGCVL